MVPVGRVVVGVNGSLSSLEALRAAVAEARRERAELLAVLAWAPMGGEAGYRRAPCPDLLALWERLACLRLRRSFEDAFGQYPNGVRVHPMVVRAAPGHGLVSLADRPDDLLVVGAGERSWPGRWFHGGTARYCASHAGCRVLLVPPPTLLSELSLRRRHRLPAFPSEEVEAVPRTGTVGRTGAVAPPRPDGR